MICHRKISIIFLASVLLMFCNWGCAISKKSGKISSQDSPHVVLKKNRPFAEQLTKRNVVYEVKYSFDLHKGHVTIPEGCVLLFSEGTLYNGVIEGSHTQVKRIGNKAVFGKNLRIEGIFKGEAFSSYYADESIEFVLSDLLTCFEKVCLDKDYTFSHSLDISNTDVVIDGGGHTISVLDLDKRAAMRFFNTKKVVVENLNFNFSKLQDVSYTGETFEGLEVTRVENSTIKNVNVRNVNSIGFLQAKSFFGILVGQLRPGFRTLIDSVSVEHVHILGNGVIGDNYGGSSAICVGHSNPKAGNATIRNVRINDVIDVDAQGNEIAEDAGGIHINAFYYEKGKLHYGSLPTIIENCQFKDVSKRLIKLQASDVVVDGIVCEQTRDLYCYAGIQTFAGKTIIKNCRGRYNGEFIRVSEQSENVFAENITIESNYKKTFPNCLKSFVGVSVANATVSLHKISASLDRGRFVAVFDNLDLKADSVTVNANSLIYSLAAVSSYNGALSFKHSDITLSGGFLTGKDVAFPILFSNSTIDLGTFIYRGPVTMNESEMRGGSLTAEGNLLFFRGGLRAVNSTFLDNKTLRRATHSNMVAVEGDSFIENVEFTTSGTTFSNGIIATSPKTTSFSINRSTCSDCDMSIVVRREIPSVVIENMDRVKLMARGSGKPSVKTNKVSFVRNELTNEK